VHLYSLETLTFFFFIPRCLFLLYLQLKELEQENEDIRLRNLRRVRTEEKLHASSENCQENGDENSNGEKVGYQNDYKFFLMAGLGSDFICIEHTDSLSTGTLVRWYIFLLKRALFDRY